MLTKKDRQEKFFFSMAQLFIDRFANRLDAYFRQIPNTTSYEACYRNVTPTSILRHFEGSHTISFPAIAKDSTSKWLAFDCDYDKGHLEEINKFLQGQGWNTLRACKRNGREGHLYLLLDSPVSALHVRRFAMEVLRTLKIPLSDSKSNESGIEIYPKQDLCTSKLSNGLRAPLGYNRKPGLSIFSWFESCPTNLKLQLEWLEQQPVNPSSSIITISENLLRYEARNANYDFKPIGITCNRIESRLRTNLLETIPVSNRTLCGGNWITQCPVCKREGHDVHKDNLHIRSDNGEVFSCWYGGMPGKIHSAVEIIKAFSK